MPQRAWMIVTLGLLAGLSASARSATAQEEFIPYIPLEPAVQFSGGANLLVYARDVNFQRPTPSIAGPDAGLLSFGNAEFDPEVGYSAFLSMRSGGVRVEAIFSEIGSWKYNQTGSLTQGIAFDTGLAGPWVGGNSISATTLFAPLNAAASPTLGGEGDEFEGLSPNTTFAGDTLPSYEILYESELSTLELNALTNNACGLWQFGLGYRNLELDEVAGVSLSGTFRAADVAGPNNGLSHASLTGPGGLTFLSGTANGFEDENGNVSGLPDILTMQSFARTSNDLNGMQAVYEQRLMYWHGWKLFGVLKAGAYHNQARGSVTDLYTGTDPDAGGDTSTYGRTLSDSETTISFVGTAGLNSNLPLGRNWSLVSGYEVLFLTGVALAPDQASGVSGGTYNINADGDVIIHGGRVGLEYSY